MGDDPDAIWDARVADIVGRDMYGKLADGVIIATDPEGNNIVMTINLKDDTAKAEEVISEDGTESKTPDGYNDPKKVNRDQQYAPEDIVEADRTGESTADVTVRDTVIAPDPNVPVISCDTNARRKTAVHFLA